MNIILKRWKKDYLRISIIIIGLTLGILSISIGLSFFQDASNFSKEMSGGDSKLSETLIYTPPAGNEDFSDNLNNVVLDLNKDYQVSIGSISYPIDKTASLSDAPSIIPSMYNKNVKWRPNLIYGRYMSLDESLSFEKKVVIGYEIYKYFFNDQDFNTNMTIDIYGDTYQIIGVVGRIKRYAPQNFQLEIPYKNYFLFFKDEPDLNNIPIQIKGNKILDLNNFNSNELQLLNKPVYENDIKIPLKLVILIGSLILLVTVINESNLFSLWLLSRKKEISIKKALGATNLMIVLETFLETLILSFISIVLSLILQFIICNKLNTVLHSYELNITFMNLLISISIAILIAILSSMIPYRIIFSTNPCNELKK